MSKPWRGHRHARQYHSKTYGTEADPHNCSFFLRIGACRHGNCCPKRHSHPTFGSTVIYEHIWLCPSKKYDNKKKKLAHYDMFVEDLMQECMKYGDIEEILTIENKGDHMIGNTFVKFHNEDQAAACIKGTQGRWYCGRKVVVRYSPVTDFDQARCRDFQGGNCKRGHFCNFAHFLPVPRWTHEYMRKYSALDRIKFQEKLFNQTEETVDPPFPVGSGRIVRMECIEKWNETREHKAKRKALSQPVVPGLGGPHKAPSQASSALNLFKPGDM